jgi:hypothetical protein
MDDLSYASDASTLKDFGENDDENGSSALETLQPIVREASTLEVVPSTTSLTYEEDDFHGLDDDDRELLGYIAADFEDDESDDDSGSLADFIVPDTLQEYDEEKDLNDEWIPDCNLILTSLSSITEDSADSSSNSDSDSSEESSTMDGDVSDSESEVESDRSSEAAAEEDCVREQALTKAFEEACRQETFTGSEAEVDDGSDERKEDIDTLKFNCRLRDLENNAFEDGYESTIDDGAKTDGGDSSSDYEPTKRPRKRSKFVVEMCKVIDGKLKIKFSNK